MFAPLALTAALIEVVFGYPKWLLQRIGHPVMWIGWLIAWCENQWNKSSKSDKSRTHLGFLALGLVIALSAGSALIISVLITTTLDNAFMGSFLSCLILGLLASTLIAQRSLHEHVQKVVQALDLEGIESARKAVSQIVGRDTTELDEPQICRATIESLSENFSDGVVAPIFWLTIAGLPGLVAYKAINTSDSMIGHLSKRYKAFGFATAKLDDLVNLPASRLAAFFIITAAALLASTSASNAYKAVKRDAQSHRSPNAGWPEAATAGALGLALAGPRTYNGNRTDDSWMGDGRRILTASDIKKALSLYRVACSVQIFLLAILAGLLIYLT